MRRRKTKFWATVTLFVLFGAVNMFLVWFDEEQEYIEQLSYIEEWEQVFEEDLYNDIQAEGTFESSTEQYSYFDEQAGSFQRFLVQEGDQVSVGDPLYEYVVRDYQADKQRLESQEEQMEEEVDALQDYRDAVQSADIPTPEEDERPFVDAELSQEEKVAKAELEMEQKEAQLEVVQDQLSALTNNGEVIEVGSQYEGTVTTINETLENPAITIKQDELVVKGTINEGDRHKLATGMKTEGFLLNEEEYWQGKLTRLSSFADQEDEKTSYYEFTVEVEDLPEETLGGYHSTVAFITEEAENATTVQIGWVQERMEELIPPEEQEEEAAEEDDNPTDESETPDQPTDQEDAVPLKKQRFVWTITDEGTTVTTPIETGLVMGDLVQVTNGLSTGVWLADENERQFREEAPFITPINRDHLSLTSVQAHENWWYGMKTGLIAR
ncbi:efflux RND transporter periplasmic adaptor subunit [Pontibacillus salicampi]|uniref:Efflux RND transporter periplasmic adaptor subunit n=1 Tax=Pontibacillus salicampi TaxID=1449801 RepID=A0ABV6LSN6_9BACI